MPSPDGVRAWQAAVQIAVRTRSLLSRFPSRGYAELRDQMMRSSESIGNNIAEGRGSVFAREYVRFLDIAARSANELSSQLTTAMKYDIVPKREAFNLNGTVICVRRMIESLRATVETNHDAERTPRRCPRKRSARKGAPKRCNDQ
jgi:four helix bundle protein